MVIMMVVGVAASVGLRRRMGMRMWWPVVMVGMSS
jgi:hypothetical protein